LQQIARPNAATPFDQTRQPDTQNGIAYRVICDSFFENFVASNGGGTLLIVFAARRCHLAVPYA
jgi:hypothetical protein